MHPIPATLLPIPGERPARARSVRHCGALSIVLLVAGCGAGTDADVDPETTSFLPANAVAQQGCGTEGHVETTVYGALVGKVRWNADSMDCEGMPRPDGTGMRLRFAGIADTTPLAIIIGVTGIGPEQTAAELPTNVTVIEEGEGRFFSTADLDACWTDIESQVVIDADTGRYAIDGTLYCISPLAEVNGSGSVSIPELRFSGLVDWGPS